MQQQLKIRLKHHEPTLFTSCQMQKGKNYTWDWGMMHEIRDPGKGDVIVPSLLDSWIGEGGAAWRGAVGGGADWAGSAQWPGCGARGPLLCALQGSGSR